MAIELNSKGSGHAGSLVKAGHIKDSDHWQSPSSESENRYIETHGLASFGAWHLGVDPSQSEDTKGRYSFPFTSDFRDVDYSGLRACIQRAAQNNHKSIADRAEALFTEAKHKLGKDKESKGSVERLTDGKFLIKSF